MTRCRRAAPVLLVLLSCVVPLLAAAPPGTVRPALLPPGTVLPAFLPPGALPPALLSPGMAAPVPPQAVPSPFEPAVLGLEMPAADVAATARLYTDVLGFRVERQAPSGAWALLAGGEVRLLLRQVWGTVPAAGGADRIRLNLRVGDLDAVIARAREAGARVDVATPQPVAIGRSVRIADASGNPLNLMDIADDGFPADGVPVVFNVSVRVGSMAVAEPFWAGLGFRVFTRDYLPETLVFERHGAVAVVLHPEEERPPERSEPVRLLLAVDDVAVAARQLGALGVEVGGRPSYLAQEGEMPVFEGPGGGAFALVPRRDVAR